MPPHKLWLPGRLVRWVAWSSPTAVLCVMCVRVSRLPVHYSKLNCIPLLYSFVWRFHAHMNTRSQLFQLLFVSCSFIEKLIYIKYDKIELCLCFTQPDLCIVYFSLFLSKFIYFQLMTKSHVYCSKTITTVIIFSCLIKYYAD